MKAKNLILGLIAIVFATGSAFTSAMSTDLTEFTPKVEVTFDEGATWECIDSDKSCTVEGMQTCTVTVVTNAGNIPVQGHLQSDTGCANTAGDDASSAGTYTPSVLPDDARD